MKRILCFLLIMITCLSTACGRSTSSPAVDGIINEIDGTIEEPLFGDADNRVDSNNNNHNNQNNDAPSKTLGTILSEDFENVMLLDGTISLNEIMETIKVNPEIVFMTEVSEINAGILQGFGDNSITGFDEGVMLSPTIPTIPFVAYVFSLDDTQDADAFARNLTSCVNLKWNEVEEAEEIVVSVVGQHVFCVISPYYFES